MVSDGRRVPIRCACSDCTRPCAVVLREPDGTVVVEVLHHHTGLSGRREKHITRLAWADMPALVAPAAAGLGDS